MLCILLLFVCRINAFDFLVMQKSQNTHSRSDPDSYIILSIAFWGAIAVPRCSVWGLKGIILRMIQTHKLWCLASSLAVLLMELSWMKEHEGKNPIHALPQRTCGWSPEPLNDRTVRNSSCLVQQPQVDNPVKAQPPQQPHQYTLCRLYPKALNPKL